MRDEVVLKLFDSDGNLFPLMLLDTGDDVTTGYTFSVQAYFDLAHEKSTNEYLLTLLERMSDYGYLAQLYFKYNDTGVSVTPQMQSFLTPVTLDTLKSYAPTVTGTNDGGVVSNGSSLMLESDTSIRHYFVLTKGAIGDYTFLVDGSAVTPVKKGDEYYVTVAHIAAKDLGVAHKIQVKNKSGTVICQIANYSALSWCYKVIKAGGGGKEFQLQIAQSLYNYNQSAKSYFNNRT